VTHLLHFIALGARLLGRQLRICILRYRERKMKQVLFSVASNEPADFRAIRGLNGDTGQLIAAVKTNHILLLD
jgi:hypothetical protein